MSASWPAVRRGRRNRSSRSRCWGPISRASNWEIRRWMSTWRLSGHTPDGTPLAGDRLRSSGATSTARLIGPLTRAGPWQVPHIRRGGLDRTLPCHVRATCPSPSRPWWSGRLRWAWRHHPAARCGTRLRRLLRPTPIAHRAQFVNVALEDANEPLELSEVESLEVDLAGYGHANFPST
jgi:hypothetical protein